MDGFYIKPHFISIGIFDGRRVAEDLGAETERDVCGS